MLAQLSSRTSDVSWAKYQLPHAVAIDITRSPILALVSTEVLALETVSASAVFSAQVHLRPCSIIPILLYRNYRYVQM